MFSLLNYFALFFAAVVGIIVFDDDPRSVSMQEWVLFIVMIYAALSFFRTYRKMFGDSLNHGDP